MRWTFRIGGLTDPWGQAEADGPWGRGWVAGLKAGWSWRDKSAPRGTELPELRQRSLTVTPHRVFLGPGLSIFMHDFLHFKRPNR